MQRGRAALAGWALLGCRPQADPVATLDVTAPEALHGCIDILSAPRLFAAAALADQHGLLIGGYFDNNEARGGQLLMVDASGALVWQREIEFSGYRGNIRERVEVRAWAAGVVGSEIEWLQWWSGPPSAELSVASRVGPDVLLAGHVQSPAGERRWHLRVDPATGAVHDEFIDGYHAAAVESPHVAWWIGDRHTSGTATLWACRVKDTGE